MKNSRMGEEKITIPVGYFCGGNCADCIYYERNDRKDDGRCWCNYYNTYYYPSERNGCAGYRAY